MITEKKLKNEIKNLKKEIFNELPKELDIEIKGIYRLHIDITDKDNKKYEKIRKNLKLRGFELIKTEKANPYSIWSIVTYNTEIWEKTLGNQKY